MRKFMSLNSSMELFLSYVFIMVVEILLMPILIMISPKSVSIFAMSFALGQIALVSNALSKTLNGITINYLLSEGISRKEILKSILIKYALSILLVSSFVSIFVYQQNKELFFTYLLFRIIFGCVFSLVFMNQFFESDPRIYFVIPFLMSLNTSNNYTSIAMSVPVSIYLYIRFKKKVMEGNLI